MKPKLIYIESANYSKESLDKLADVFNITICNPDNIKNNLSNAEVILSSLEYFLSAADIKLALQLKYIITNTTGLNHIDIDAISDNIKLISLRDNAQILDISATAEHTWALILLNISLNDTVTPSPVLHN